MSVTITTLDGWALDLIKVAVVLAKLGLFPIAWVDALLANRRRHHEQHRHREA